MTKDNQLKIWQYTETVTGIFCLIVALLLLLNFWQIRKYDPLESKSLQQLIQRLSESPGDESLKQDIRSLDLLARKAYFTSRWQVRTGSHLLLFGALLFVLAVRMRHTLTSAISIPGQEASDELKGRRYARRGILVTGVVLLLGALAASLATDNYLDSFGGEDEPVSAVATDPSVEVIDVGAVPESIPADTPASADTASLQMAATSPADSVSSPAEASPPDASLVRANYPSFRGPFGNGVSGFTNIPVDFDGPSGKNIRWKVAVPLPGYNSPVIWGDKLFVSGASAQKREVYCFDRYGGKLLWSAPVDQIPGSPATSPKTTDDTGLAAPSVTTDGIRVYALFGNGDIIALDMNGTRMWARNLGVPDNHYGHSSSLLVWKNLLYIQYDTNQSRKLMALTTTSGQTAWETSRNVKVSWASPILARVGGNYQVILSADPLVAGYDAATGRQIWAVEAMMGEVGPSPAFGEGLVFAANEYARLAAIDPADGRIVWEQDEYLPEVASPVVSSGLLFVATSYGVLACYEALTGVKLWEHDGGVGYYSSPVITDGKLFLFDTGGHLSVFALSREKTLLSEANLGTKVTSTPAFANGRMYVRTAGTLWCIGQ